MYAGNPFAQSGNPFASIFSPSGADLQGQPVQPAEEEKKKESAISSDGVTAQAATSAGSSSSDTGNTRRSFSPRVPSPPPAKAGLEFDDASGLSPQHHVPDSAGAGAVER